MALTILGQEGKRALLMGNEAIARGAIEAGVEIASAYPGTPSSEVLEALWPASREAGFYAEWSTNEKVSIEVAAGAALTGARALCAMKNAGLNVAMDTFATLPYTGVRGGLVIIVADDPGAHYSSTEQDTRPLAAYAELPCLEPADQAEARDMTREAFTLSEALELPVMVRSVTRLSHASGDVALGAIPARKRDIGFNKHYKIQYRWNVYGAPGAVSKHRWLHGVLARAGEMAETSPFNSLRLAAGRPRFGVVASGLGYGYIRDVLVERGLIDQVDLLKLGFVHPLPKQLIARFLERVDHVLVVEDGDPYIERYIVEARGSRTVTVYGKLAGPDQVFEPWGEMDPDIASRGLTAAAGRLDLTLPPAGDSVAVSDARAAARSLVAPRSSTLCPGCPHLGSYWALKQALGRLPGTHIINGDIGCYEQGGYGLFAQNIDVSDSKSAKYPIRSPYETLDTLYVMGSGLGMAQGQSHIPGIGGKVVAVSGDSTLFHANLPSVANAAMTSADIVYIVFDNRWTAMTGHQPSPRTGLNQINELTPTIDIEQTVRALGIKRVYRASAFRVKEARGALNQALAESGPAVVILEGECALQLARRKETKPAPRVDTSKCNGCRTCIQLGCPAVTFDTASKKAGIDATQCIGCGICVAVCPSGAMADLTAGGESK